MATQIKYIDRISNEICGINLVTMISKQEQHFITIYTLNREGKHVTVQLQL